MAEVAEVGIEDLHGIVAKVGRLEGEVGSIRDDLGEIKQLLNRSSQWPAIAGVGAVLIVAILSSVFTVMGLSLDPIRTEVLRLDTRNTRILDILDERLPVVFNHEARLLELETELDAQAGMIFKARTDIDVIHGERAMETRNAEDLVSDMIIKRIQGLEAFAAQQSRRE